MLHYFWYRLIPDMISLGTGSDIAWYRILHFFLISLDKDLISLDTWYSVLFLISLGYSALYQLFPITFTSRPLMCGGGGDANFTSIGWVFIFVHKTVPINQAYVGLKHKTKPLNEFKTRIIRVVPWKISVCNTQRLTLIRQPLQYEQLWHCLFTLENSLSESTSLSAPKTWTKRDGILINFIGLTMVLEKTSPFILSIATFYMPRL